MLQYRKRLGVMALIVGIAGAVIQAAPPDVWGRIASLSKVTSQATIATADKWGSAEQRSDIWRVARAIIADHPVTGVGVGNYGEMHARYANTGQFKGTVQGRRDAHSTYLSTAAETGFPGLILFLAMIGSVFVMGWRAVGRLKKTDPASATGLRTLLFGLIAFLQACLFATMTHLPFLYLYLAVICTMIAVSQGGPSASIAAPHPARRR
jgi:O-antigen ligase